MTDGHRNKVTVRKLRRVKRSDLIQVDLTEEHGKRTRALMKRCLIIWVFFAILIHLFVESLNQIDLFGFPLGWFMSAQGSLIIFVVLCFWYSNRQNKIDQDCDLAEED